MPTHGKNSIADQLSIADIRIDNSLNSEDIKIAVAKKGYNEVKLQEGKNLVNCARAAVTRQVDLEGTAQKATQVELSCKVIAEKAYQDLAKTARTKYKPGSPELIKLGLIGKQPKATADFNKVGRKLCSTYNI